MLQVCMMLCIFSLYRAKNFRYFCDLLYSVDFIIHTGRFGGVHAFGYNFAESEPICMKSGTPWVHRRGLALADFGHDPPSNDSWRA